MSILITGAAGNLGSLLARHLLAVTSEELRLMVHRKDVPEDVKCSPRVRVVRADLGNPGNPETLAPALDGCDAVVHFAGVLFRANPERFLPQTNTGYFTNLVDAARRKGVPRIVLISFPHVEGPTCVSHPARGRLDGNPISVHARTRLEEERYLFEHVEVPISLRVGMVYGSGILMVDAARWLARHRLLAVWKERTQIHLISREDFCAAATAAVLNPEARGIYHLGDDGNDSLQEFLRVACGVWGLRPPRTLPLWMIHGAAEICELASRLFGVQAPLTRDFIDIGRVSYYGDTSRMKRDLLPALRYPTLAEGKGTLR